MNKIKVLSTPTNVKNRNELNISTEIMYNHLYPSLKLIGRNIRIHFGNNNTMYKSRTGKKRINNNVNKLFLNKNPARNVKIKQSKLCPFNYKIDHSGEGQYITNIDLEKYIYGASSIEEVNIRKSFVMNDFLPRYEQIVIAKLISNISNKTYGMFCNFRKSRKRL